MTDTIVARLIERNAIRDRILAQAQAERQRQEDQK